MQVGRRCRDKRMVELIPSSRITLLRKDDGFCPKGLPVQKKFDAVTIRKSNDRNNLAFTSCPIPVGEKMDHRCGGPLALIEIVPVFGKAAKVKNTRA